MPDIVKESRAVTTWHVNVSEDQIREVLPGHGEAGATGVSFKDVVAYSP
jgi:hypothetical protein